MRDHSVEGFVYIYYIPWHAAVTSGLPDGQKGARLDLLCCREVGAGGHLGRMEWGVGVGSYIWCTKNSSNPGPRGGGGHMHKPLEIGNKGARGSPS